MYTVIALLQFIGESLVQKVLNIYMEVLFINMIFMIFIAKMYYVTFRGCPLIRY